MLRAVAPTGAVPAVDERTLIAEAARGDRRAARALYEAHVDRVHRLCTRIAGDADLADDLTQDTFVQVFRRLDQFRGEPAFSTWVHRVALTVSLNAMRKVKRFRQRETVLEEVDASGHHEHADGRIEPDLQAQLHAAIDALPDGLRMALVLHTIEGYSHAEVGELLGIAEGTSKARVFDARARLRVALGPHLKERTE
ncbi:MAG: RNA polymerase sigma factor [Gemmatimonadetes bacterium]|nr:RNA polymerase sigma factor [Gemmatimonadota bacterium]